MNAERERSRSCWLEGSAPVEAPQLDRSLTVEVAVVGSGIAGLSVAYELWRRGREVVLIDRGTLGRGMTARTTAHLAFESDDFYHEIIARRGREMARLHFESQRAAVDRLEEIQRREGIACDFARLDGILAFTPPYDRRTLERELAACHEIGWSAVRMCEPQEVGRLGGEGGLLFPRQGRFHPLKYVDGLLALLSRSGVALYADTAVVEVREASGKVELHTRSGHTVTAANAVLATNSPINSRLAVHGKQAPYRTYAFAAEVAKGTVTDALYWDTDEPYHYVRLQPGDERDLLIVGGADHKPGEADDGERRLRGLEEWAAQRFPEMGKMVAWWSGQVQEPIDGVGFIGLSPGDRHTYIATGDSGQGMTHGAVAGMLIADLITEGDSPWRALHEPSRKPVRAAGTLLSENLTAVASFAEYVTPGEVASAEECRPGEGAVMRQGLTKLAVCRDLEGEVHRHSASCTHAGCIVHWNSFEQCWDCPCHGSHFAPDGTVLNAPAVQPLKPAGE